MHHHLICAALAATACAALDTATVESAEAGCSLWGCKENTATTTDGRVFHDHDLGLAGTGGAVNSGGFRITGIETEDGTAMALGTVPGDLDQLVGTVGEQTLVGDQLVGTRIRMSDGSTSYTLELVNVDRVEFWVGGDEAPAYQFAVYPGNDEKDRHWLCRAEHGDVEGWPLMHHAVVFRGDRYDAKRKTVTVAGESDTWINIACAATAPAKLHLLRHTTAGELGAIVATQADRQAMFKLIVADYCGDGTVYTEDGHRLAWAEHHGWYDDGTDVSQPLQRKRLEALWTAAGAQCLDTPRMYDLSKIHCRKPTCADNVTGWQQYARAVSVNRSPQQPGPPPSPPASP